jgi:hypothetical protein
MAPAPHGPRTSKKKNLFYALNRAWLDVFMNWTVQSLTQTEGEQERNEMESRKQSYRLKV